LVIRREILPRNREKVYALSHSKFKKEHGGRGETQRPRREWIRVAKTMIKAQVGLGHNSALIMVPATCGAGVQKRSAKRVAFAVSKSFAFGLQATPRPKR